MQGLSSPSGPMRSIAIALFFSCVSSSTILALTMSRFAFIPYFVFWYGPIMMVTSHAGYLRLIIKNHLPSPQDEPENASQRTYHSIFGNGGGTGMGTILETWFLLLGYPPFTSSQEMIHLRWPDDRVEILLRAAYLFQVISSILIVRFSIQMFRKDNEALCLVSHEWACNQCSIKYTSEGETRVQPENTNTSSTWVHPETILVPGLVISLTINTIIIWVVNTLLWNTDRHNSNLLSAFAAVNTCQNIYHLKQLSNLRSRLTLGVEHPPIDVVMRYQRAMHLASGPFLLLFLFTFTAGYMSLGLEPYGFNNIPSPIIALYWIEAIVIIVNIWQAIRIVRRNGKAAVALCPRYGHNWVCGRGCSAMLKDENV